MVKETKLAFRLKQIDAFGQHIGPFRLVPQNGVQGPKRVYHKGARAAHKHATWIGVFFTVALAVFTTCFTASKL